MRTSIRTVPLLLAFAGALLLAGVLAGVGASPAPAATTYLPPALYVGGNAALSGTAKITSPMVGTPSQPSAAIYVKGKLANTSPGSLSTVKQVIGAAAPPLSQFMPASRIAQLTLASQAAKQEGRVYPSLSYSGTQNVTFTGPITVNGNLSISGSGTYTFDSVYVTGSVAISNPSARFSFASLRVGGSLAVSGGIAKNWGPTYVAGSVSLSGKEQWNMSLLVSGGSLAISGTQIIGGDGVGSHAKPVTMLLTGQSKGMSYSSSGTYYGLLCNQYGAFSQSSTGHIKGSVLCGGSGAISSSASIAYDSNVGSRVLGVAPPTTTALVNGAPLPAASWYRTSPVTITLSSVANDWATVTGISYTVNNGLPGAFTGSTGSFTVPAVPYPVPPDGTYTVQYWAQDSIGNTEAAKTLVINIDKTVPSASGAASPTGNGFGWNNGDVTVTGTGSDPGGSGIDAATWHWSSTKDGGNTPTVGTGDSVPLRAEGTYSVTFTVSDKAGNASLASEPVVVKLDKTDPTLTPNKAPDFDWVGGSVDVAAHAADALSGLDGVTWSCTKDGATGESGSGESLQLTDEGVYVVTFTATDRAGNSGSGEITVKIDTTAPVTRDNAPPDWQSAAVTVTLTPTDDLSGVDKTWFKLDGGAWTVGTSVDVPADVKGEHTILYYSTDKATPASVEAVKSAKVYIGSSTPAISVSGYPTTGAGWTTQPVTLLFDVDPGASGFGGIEYKLDGGEWITVEQPVPPYMVEISAEGRHTVSYRLIGAAGTPTADGQCSFGIDGTPPVVTLQSLADGSTTGYNKPALLFTPEDGAVGSGFDPQQSAAEITLDGRSFSAGSGYLFPTKLDDGEHTLLVTVSDLAGNEGSASSYFTIDAPVFAVQPETVYEGDAVGLYASDLPDVGDQDGGQEGRTWQWSMARGADDPEPDAWAEGPVGYMVPDAATDYVVELTVTDTTTHAASVTSSTIDVLPQAPRIHALDVDVLRGGSADLVARFLDPGWTDVHTASWAIDGQSSAGALTEDDVPAMESGFISGTTGVVDGDAGVRGGTLSVTDSDLETPTPVTRSKSTSSLPTRCATRERAATPPLTPRPS